MINVTFKINGEKIDYQWSGDNSVSPGGGYRAGGVGSYLIVRQITSWSKIQMWKMKLQNGLKENIGESFTYVQSEGLSNNVSNFRNYEKYQFVYIK